MAKVEQLGKQRFTLLASKKLMRVAKVDAAKVDAGGARPLPATKRRISQNIFLIPSFVSGTVLAFCGLCLPCSV